MFARVLVEFILAALLIWQLIIPLFSGTPLCPLFRRRRRAKLLVEMEHAREDLVEDTLEQQLAALKERHAKSKGCTEAQPSTDQPSPGKKENANDENTELPG